MHAVRLGRNGGGSRQRTINVDFLVPPHQLKEREASLNSSMIDDLPYKRPSIGIDAQRASTRSMSITTWNLNPEKSSPYGN
jgi:hypothetical protein